ncbi:MAG: hypothetical protein L0Y58_18735 [Verrucomicrobia subdivision 3 bacterium]|nr:hypothetical protein [Limisphaerales bacterium]
MMCALGAVAHDSPEHQIEALTAKMAANGKSAELLSRRAIEWRALGKLESSKADLAEALTLKPESSALWADLARVCASLRQPDAAIAAIDQALRVAAKEADSSVLLVARGEILESAGKFELALADCEKAFQLKPAAPDWYLMRARLQFRCGKLSEAAAGLKEGYERTGSAVLEIEWIEAMIDAGANEAALERIEPRIDRSRWQAGWLIRRARAQLGLGQQARAKEDLQAALAELSRRIRTDSPDPTLISERGLARALLGQRDAALEDLKLVRKLCGENMALHRLEAVVR